MIRGHDDELWNIDQVRWGYWDAHKDEVWEQMPPPGGE